MKNIRKLHEVLHSNQTTLLWSKPNLKGDLVVRALLAHLFGRLIKGKYLIWWTNKR